MKMRISLRGVKNQDHLIICDKCHTWNCEHVKAAKIDTVVTCILHVNVRIPKRFIKHK
jgi:hypothetical protein